MASKKYKSQREVCFNPFKRECHTKFTGLRKIQQWMIDIEPNITPTNKICDTCRINLRKLKDSKISIAEEVDREESFESQEMVVLELNNSLQHLDESPISNKKMNYKKYKTSKYNNVSASIKKKLFPDLALSMSYKCPESEVIVQLKEKFQTTTNNKERIKLLSVLPKSWSIRMMMDEFKISKFMALKVKNLVKEQGILSHLK